MLVIEKMKFAFVLKDSVPPVIAFHFGSLGFLSPFDFTEFKSRVDSALCGKTSYCSVLSYEG